MPRIVKLTLELQDAPRAAFVAQHGEVRIEIENAAPVDLDRHAVDHIIEWLTLARADMLDKRSMSGASG
jgi:hypothetical protein